MSGRGRGRGGESSNPPASNRYYAVRNGRSPGIYNSWRECEANTSGYSNAVFKKFDSRAEAERFVANQQSSSGSSHSSPSGGYQSRSNYNYSSSYSAGPSRSFSHSSQSSTGNFSRISANPSNVPAQNVVYVDGSCRGNGKDSAHGGYGVHWPSAPERNISAPLSPTEPQTNQRAELRAIIAALETVKQEPGDLEIRSDSSYAINGLTEWSQRWVQKGWEGVDVVNQDLFKEALRLGEERSAGGMGRVFMRHVPAHQGEAGNEEADRLARLGAAERHNANN